MARVYLLIIALILVNSSILAQENADSVKVTTFRKGRNLVGVGGAVSSSYSDRTQFTSNPSDLGNSYRFNVKLGKFVANKNLVGISFDASRTHLIGYVETIAEVLGVGPDLAADM